MNGIGTVPATVDRMKQLRFDNRFVAELPGDPVADPHRRRQVVGAAWSAAEPTPVAAPQLVAWSPEVAELVGFTADFLHRG